MILNAVCSQVLKVEDFNVTQIAATSIISKPREKVLIETNSWSTNSLIKLYFKLKELLKLNEELLKGGVKSLVQILRDPSNLIILNELAGIT